MPFSKISKCYNNLKLVLISHIHGDHFKKSTIKKLIYEKPTVAFGVGSYLVQELIDLGVKPNKIYVLDAGNKYDLGSITIEPIQLYHDVENQGWKIMFKNDNYKVFYAVDTATLDGITAKNYDLYLVEGNYDKEEIIQRKEQKLLNGEYQVENRVINSHLSKEQWTDFILENASDTSECVQLHQHIERS